MVLFHVRFRLTHTHTLTRACMHAANKSILVFESNQMWFNSFGQLLVLICQYAAWLTLKCQLLFYCKYALHACVCMCVCVSSLEHLNSINCGKRKCWCAEAHTHTHTTNYIYHSDTYRCGLDPADNNKPVHSLWFISFSYVLGGSRAYAKKSIPASENRL